MSVPGDLPDDFVQHVIKTLHPMIEGASVYIGLSPSGAPDVKFCLELGTAIMFGKPLVIVAGPGTEIPPGLRRVANEVIEGLDFASPEFVEKLGAVARRYALEDMPG